MEQKSKIEEYRNLLNSIYKISTNINEVIWTKFYDTNKYLFNQYAEAYKSLECFCELLRIGGVGQAASVLRMAIEFASAAEVLNKFPEFQQNFEEHCRFRFSIKNLKSKAQKGKIIEHYSEKKLSALNALNYLDYGWTTESGTIKNYGQHELVSLAGFEDIIPWIDILNMFIHGTTTAANYADSEGLGAICISHMLIEIAAKLTDHLCCSLHNKTGFSFIFNGINEFENFRKYYQSI